MGGGHRARPQNLEPRVTCLTHLVDDQQVGDGLSIRADHVAALLHSLRQDLLNLLSDDAFRKTEQNLDLALFLVHRLE